MSFKISDLKGTWSVVIRGTGADGNPACFKGTASLNGFGDGWNTDLQIDGERIPGLKYSFLTNDTLGQGKINLSSHVQRNAGGNVASLLQCKFVVASPTGDRLELQSSQGFGDGEMIRTSPDYQPLNPNTPVI